MNLKQFKMTNNDEIICEVVEDANTQEDGAIIVRKALRILTSEDYENNIRYYSFKPLISFQDAFDELVVMNVGHIILETLPSRTLTIHYARAVKEVEAQEASKAQRDINIEKMMQEIDGLDEEGLTEWVEKKLLETDEISTTGLVEEDYFDSADSDKPNVIQFRPKGTMH